VVDETADEDELAGHDVGADAHGELGVTAKAVVVHGDIVTDPAQAASP
jgi:hypothetical protein